MSGIVRVRTLVIAIACLMTQTPLDGANAKRLEFNPLTKHFSGANVEFIQEDLYEDGSFLISTGRGIASLNKGKKLAMIVGTNDATIPKGYKEGVGKEAVFGDISGFAQFNKSMLIIADGSNRCLRAADRSARKHPTQRLTKSCDQDQDRISTDGLFSMATFTSPGMLIKGRSEDEYFLTERMYGSIRIVAPVSKRVDTFLNKEEAGWGSLGFPFAMVFDGKVTLYVATFSDIYKINITMKAAKGLAEGGRGKTDGKLSEAQFHPTRSLSMIANNFLVAVSGTSDAFRLIDLHRELVSTVLTHSKQHLQTSCVLNVPREKALYFGGDYGVTKMDYRFTNSSARQTAAFLKLPLLLLLSLVFIG